MLREPVIDAPVLSGPVYRLRCIVHMPFLARTLDASNARRGGPSSKTASSVRVGPDGTRDSAAVLRRRRALLVKFVAHRPWDPAKRDCLSAHDMLEDVAAALKGARPVVSRRPARARRVPWRLSRWSTLGVSSRSGAGARPSAVGVRAADRNGTSNRPPSKWQKKLVKTVFEPFRLPEMCLFHEAGFFENADSAGPGKLQKAPGAASVAYFDSNRCLE